MSDDSTVAVAEPAEPARRDTLGLVLSGVGQTLITAGMVVLLFVVYEVWITNIFADHRQNALKNKLIVQYLSGADKSDDPVVEAEQGLPNGQQYTIPAGTGIAVLYIPRFGPDFARAIVEGTDSDDLDKGPGHYNGTQLPGQKGNFAVAGHRVGHGEPFLNLDQLQAGDPVVVRTQTTWYIYTVLGNAATNDLSVRDVNGVPGREIVSPSNTTVIAPIPDKTGSSAASTSIAYLTLTTCHPKFSATQRMIVHGTLTRTVAASGTALPKELLGGTL